MNDPQRRITKKISTKGKGTTREKRLKPYGHVHLFIKKNGVYKCKCGASE